MQPVLSPSASGVPSDALLDLVQGLHAVLWELDLASHALLFISDGVEAILGYPPRRFLEEPDFMDRRVVHPDDRAVAALACTPEPVPLEAREAEFRAVRADGGVVWLRNVVRLVRDAEGNAVRLRGVMFDITDQVRSREALREREMQLSEAQAIASLGSWEWDAEADRVTWSDELYRIYGLEPGSFPATVAGYLERVHPDDRERVRATIGEALRERGRFDFEERIVRPDGEVRVLRSRGHAVVDAGGRATRLVGTCSDVTEMVRAREQLLLHEAQLAEAQAIAGLGSWEWDIAADRIRWSEQQFRLHGEEPLAHIDFAWFFSHVHPEDQAWMGPAMERSLATGEPFEFPYRVVWPTGEVRWLNARGKLEMSTDGRPLRMVGTSQDITAMREAEAAARASAESYRAIFENASDAMWLHDIDTGAFLETNRAACEMYGYTVEEMLALGVQGVSWGEPPYDIAHARQYIRRAVAGEPQRFEWLCRHRDGSPVWTEVRLQRVTIAGEPRILATGRDIGDRKAAEDALRRVNEELERRVAERTAQLEDEVRDHEIARAELLHRTQELEAIFQGLPDLYFRLRRDGTILDYRASAADGLYVPPEEFLGRPVQEVLPPEAAARVGDAIRRVAATGERVLVEYDLPHAGGVCDFEARLLPLGGDQMIAVVRDVTDRKRSERALRESEEHFRRLIEAAHDLVETIAPDGRVTYIGPSVQRVLGYAPEEFTGVVAMDPIHPDDRQGVREATARAMASPGETIHVEYRIRDREGRWRWMEALGRTLSAEAPEQGLVVNARDITERKEAEAELERQRQYFEQLITRVNHGIAAWDPQGRFEYMSPNSLRDPSIRERVMGLTHAEYGKVLGLAPEKVALRQHYLQQAIETREITEFEETIRTPEGVEIHLLRRNCPILNEAGEVERVVGYSIDITQRKRTEEALQLAKEEAEAANRAKSEFLSRMSHELRTPMNSILGFAQVLEGAGLPPQAERSVQHILRAGRHLLQLINEVLDIARIEAGRHDLSLEPVRLTTVLQEAIGLVRPLAAQWRVEVEPPLAEGDAWVHADRQRLVQVVLNLLSNAIKYNRPGGRVQLSSRREDGRLVVRVADTGRGIPRDSLHQLFTPFGRLGAERSDVEGTGLGLALSQRLTEAMGGALALESTGPEGTVFRLVLEPAASPLHGVEESATPEGGRDAAPHAPALILYVEDNLANLSLVETILLSRPKWRTMPALQGRLGVELAREHRPDLVLLDLHLPDVSGEEVLRQLRADPRTATLPVVVISADATRSTIERLLAAGAAAFLTKPLDVREFLDTLQRLLPAGEAR